jgi:hypothetical protein
MAMVYHSVAGKNFIISMSEITKLNLFHGCGAVGIHCLGIPNITRGLHLLRKRGMPITCAVFCLQ